MKMSKINIKIKKINKSYIEENFNEILSGLYPQRKESVLKLKNRQAVYTSVAAGELLIGAYNEIYGSGGNAPEVLKGENGKPYVKDKEEFAFNISHSGDYAVIAYSNEPGIKAVGIDVERIRQRDDDMKLANRFFTKSEIDYISDGLECSDIDMRFYKIWTMKEAFMKLTGKGLGQRLDSFSVNPDDKSIDIIDEKIYEYVPCIKDNNDLKIHYDIKSVDGYVVSVCVCCLDVEFCYM